MNKIKYMKLSDVCVVQKGKQLNKSELNDSGIYEAWNGGTMFSGYTDKYNVKGETTIISQGGASAGFVNFVNYDFWANAHCYYLEPNIDIINNKYLFYFVKNSQKDLMDFKHGAGIPALDKAKIENLLISVPEIKTQNEIVEVLDKFSALEAELEAELEARTKQYEYYRNKLLDFSTGSVGVPRIDKMLAEMCPNGVALKTLGETCKIERGKVFSKQYIRENPGTYPLYSSQTLNDGLLGLIDSYNYDGEYLNWTTDGANAGTIFHRKGKFSITNVSGLIKPKEENINIRYLYYILSITAKSYVSYGMGNPKLMSNVMSTVVYPLPPLEIQNIIVKILDNFSEYVTSISQGLPAEIELRRKQYEYYRNKLLTFDKE